MTINNVSSYIVKPTIMTLKKWSILIDSNTFKLVLCTAEKVPLLTRPGLSYGVMLVSFLGDSILQMT